jgi:hypothetical protein
MLFRAGNRPIQQRCRMVNYRVHAEAAGHSEWKGTHTYVALIDGEVRFVAAPISA